MDLSVTELRQLTERAIEQKRAAEHAEQARMDRERFTQGQQEAMALIISPDMATRLKKAASEGKSYLTIRESNDTEGRPSRWADGFNRIMSKWVEKHPGLRLVCRPFEMGGGSDGPVYKYLSWEIHWDEPEPNYSRAEQLHGLGRLAETW